MAARVDVDEVKNIISTGLEDRDIRQFCTTAHVIVANNCADLTEDEYTQIELYLAAHFICLKDPRLIQEKTEDWDLKYQKVTSGEGLNSTEYGRTALLLDSSGGLQQIGKMQVIFEAL